MGNNYDHSHKEVLGGVEMWVPNLDEVGIGVLQKNNLSKTHPEFYKYVNKLYPENFSWFTKLYMFKNNMSEPPRCPICGEYVGFRTWEKGFNKYCGLGCSNKDPEVNKKKLIARLKNKENPQPKQTYLRTHKEVLNGIEMDVPDQDNHYNNLREKNLKINHSDFVNYVNEHYQLGRSWMEKLYMFYNHKDEPPKCKREGCNNYADFNNITNGWNEYCCIICSNKDRNYYGEITLEDLKEKYGDIRVLTDDVEIPDFDNLTEQQLRRRDVRNHYPKFYIYLENTYPNTTGWMEKIYMFLHKINEPEKCKCCGKNLKFNTLSTGYGVYCSVSCLNKHLGPQTYKHMMEVYKERTGYNHPSQDPNIRRKTILTNNERFGCDNPQQNPQVIEKYSNTRKRQFMELHPFVQSIETINDKWVCTCECVHPECDKCKDKTFKICSDNLRSRIKYDSELCTILNPIGSNSQFISQNEKEDRKIFDNLGISHIDNNRSIISPLELDIYCPDYNIAIEENGVWCHTFLYEGVPEKPVTVKKDQHTTKWLKCYEKGIELISFWSDWDFEDKYLYGTIKLRSKMNPEDETLREELKEISQYYKQKWFPDLDDSWWPLDMGWPPFEFDPKDLKEHFCTHLEKDLELPCFDSGIIKDPSKI